MYRRDFSQHRSKGCSAQTTGDAAEGNGLKQGLGVVELFVHGLARPLIIGSIVEAGSTHAAHLECDRADSKPDLLGSGLDAGCYCGPLDLLDLTTVVANDESCLVLRGAVPMLARNVGIERLRAS